MVPVRCGARNAGEHENIESLPQWQSPSNVAHDGPCISAGNSRKAALPFYLTVKITTQLQSVYDCIQSLNSHWLAWELALWNFSFEYTTLLLCFFSFPGQISKIKAGCQAAKADHMPGHSLASSQHLPAKSSWGKPGERPFDGLSRTMKGEAGAGTSIGCPYHMSISDVVKTDAHQMSIKCCFFWNVFGAPPKPLESRKVSSSLISMCSIRGWSVLLSFWHVLIPT